MQLRYQDLQGKRVVDADGVGVGRVSDLVSEPDGSGLRVTALRVGPAAAIRRITFRYLVLWHVASRAVPWTLVARIDDAIHLRVGAADLTERPLAHDAEQAEERGRA